jgi:hypothetical protein
MEARMAALFGASFGSCVILPIRTQNPIYNPRRYEFLPRIPDWDQHIPDGFPKLAVSRVSGSRTAHVSEIICDTVIPAGGAVSDSRIASGPPDVDDDSDHDEGIHPSLLRDMANSPLHLLTHRPFNRFCDACVMGKMQKKHKFRGSFDRPLKRWGEVLSADHIDSKSDLNVSHEGHRFALVIKDIWSKLFAIYPVVNKSA